jgi:hypothetical protein
MLNLCHLLYVTCRLLLPLIQSLPVVLSPLDNYVHPGISGPQNQWSQLKPCEAKPDSPLEQAKTPPSNAATISSVDEQATDCHEVLDSIYRRWT